MGEESNFTHRIVSNHLCGYCPLWKVEFIPFHPSVWTEFKKRAWFGTGGWEPEVMEEELLGTQCTRLTLCGPSGGWALAGRAGGPSQDLHTLGSGGAPGRVPCPGSCGGGK